MLTPQDIQDVKFVRSMKGYDKDQVEDFLDTVHSDYSALYKENATLKGKMRVLVDKIEEYRSVDEQMRKAFYSAQVTAQETVAKAQAEADMILRNARQNAEGRVNDIRCQIEAEEARLEQIKAESRRYAEMMKGLLTQNIGFIDTLMEKTAPSAAPVRQPEAAPAAAEQPAPAEPEAPAEADEAAAMVEELDIGGVIDDIASSRGEKEPDIDDSTRFIFSDLRFGKDYKEED